MGQIVIDIPTNARRRYIVADRAGAAALLSSLDASAVRIKGTARKPTRQEMEDLRDYQAARKNFDEMRRTGVSFSVDELRKEFGLV